MWWRHKANIFATRVLAFGDESSLINPNQSKYTVNALLAGSNTAYDCASNPIWIQSLAAIYGLYFPQCPDPTGIVAVSRIYAANGARVADLSAQIDAAIANDGISSNDMTTVYVGANDIVAQFNQYPMVSENVLLANLDTAGAALAAQVNRLAGLGARVIVSTAPNMGLTPFAGDRSANSTDPNPSLLARLSVRFNDAMLANLINNGHEIGLVQFDEYLQLIDTATRANTSSGYANTTLPACTVALPNCTTNTLAPDAINASWLWADNLHLGPTGQAALASLAITRAQNNPF